MVLTCEVCGDDTALTKTHLGQLCVVCASLKSIGLDPRQCLEEGVQVTPQ